MTENNQKTGRYKTKAPSRGGVRKNAGRKEGAATKKTREIADREVENGLTPLEVMLKTMRIYVDEAVAYRNVRTETGEIDAQSNLAALQLLEKASEVAAKAAPYIHPRLASVEHSAKDPNAQQTSGVLVVPAMLSVDEWVKKNAEKSVDKDA